MRFVLILNYKHVRTAGLRVMATFLTLSLYQCTYNNEIEANRINTGFGNLKV
jgi:hypothetical protein